LQSLAVMRRDQTPSGPIQFMGIGNPRLGPPMARSRSAVRSAPVSTRLFRASPTRSGNLVADISSLRNLASLPGTARELEAIRNTVGQDRSTLLTGEGATERHVRSADLSDATLIVFSTHGLTASEAVGVGESGLVLTPPEADEGTGDDDGFLSASEVTGLSFSADFVILSACNTAVGDGAASAGLGQLARSFLFAGARNLLASHWPVSDEVAPILVTRTLALMQEGVDRAEAVRRAVREVRMDSSHDSSTETWAHPFYWAPFVLIGDGAR
jgi:CHAT domain-containing protein